jgi:flavin reductase (DIM6/NTAB) family NADH-FMN oxidoreductase RutF
MKQWRCKICGYIHVGGTPPEKCPVCGAGPEYFELLDEVVSENNQRETRTSGTAPLAGRNQIQEVLFQIPCGLFIVTTADGGKFNGMINNTVFQITDQPLQILLGMDKSHLTTELIEKSGVFAVIFLKPDQLPLVKRFGFKSGREVDKFAGIGWHPGVSGAPILDEAVGFLECEVRNQTILDAGTHRVFLATVLTAEIEPEAPVLTYQQYRRRKSELWDNPNG